MEIIDESIDIIVSLVVAPIDDFTGKPISGSRLRVWIEGEKPAIVKSEGYYVFVNLRSPDVVVKLEGGYFQHQEVKVTVADYNDKVMKVRMIPSHSYPIPANATCIQGRALNRTTIYAYCDSLKNPYKLLYNYDKKEDEMQIFHPDDVDMEGRKLYIKSKDNESGEVMLLSGLSDPEKKSYKLVEKLNNSYKKIGTVLYPLYVIEPDEKGDFYLPLPDLTEKSSTMTFFCKGDEDKKIQKELVSGRVNQISI